VSTKTVLKGIRNGKIAAAGLDVLEIEKFPALADQEWFKELSESKKVIMSPHIAGWTHESYFKISEVLAQKLQALISEF
jgi:D-3-phosphoglycerate dehydrogenase